MKSEFCVLFDMDGVLLDTETQYSIIWKKMGDRYNAGIDNFEYTIKGTTLPNILKKYFSHLSEEEVTNMVNELSDFENNMQYEWIKGSKEFVEELRRNEIKTGLVTSSNNDKMNAVYKQIDMRLLMDTIVSADRITIGKPDPMCYLLAAEDLGFAPENCFVFEDSFAGLESGSQAGMKVIGLSTTHPENKLKGKCELIIPNFEDFNLEHLRKLSF